MGSMNPFPSMHQNWTWLCSIDHDSGLSFITHYCLIKVKNVISSSWYHKNYAISGCSGDRCVLDSLSYRKIRIETLLTNAALRSLRLRHLDSLCTCPWCVQARRIILPPNRRLKLLLQTAYLMLRAAGILWSSWSTKRWWISSWWNWDPDISICWRRTHCMGLWIRS
jgi:hypothetical protein